MIGKIFVIVFIMTALLVGCERNVRAQHRHIDKDLRLTKQLVTIRGVVTQTAGAGDEPLRVVGAALVFQKVGCKKCFVLVSSDLDGEYRLIIGPGRYRVIVQICGDVQDHYDCLSPDQQRTIEAARPGMTVDFDIKLKRRPTKWDMVLPASEAPAIPSPGGN